MRRPIAVVLTLFGAALAAVGIAAAVVVGPDGVVERTAEPVAVDGGAAIVSGSGLLALRDATVVVGAQSSAGEVFLGRAHPVDVRSYLGSSTRYVLSLDGQGRLTTRRSGGDEKPDLLADPATLTLWTDRASGDGAQTMTLELTGEPSQLVVVPADRSGQVTVSTGLRLPALWWTGIAAAAAGVAALLGGVLLFRRPRPNRAQNEQS